MKAKFIIFLALLLVLASARSALTAVLYVDLNGPNPIPPYTSWATASTNIQDALDAAVAGDEIVVTDGIYATGQRSVDHFSTNRVVVDKPLTLRSLNGPQSVVIDGAGRVRCVYLTSGASLLGFTLTNGFARGGSAVFNGGGGGVLCESVTSVVSNCVMAGNAAWYGGGARGGTLNHCTLRGNSAVADCILDCPSGGGAYGSTLNDCTLLDNVARWGGGAGSCRLNNCTLKGNSSGASSSMLNGCTLSGNGWGAVYSYLTNCILTGNWGGAAGGVLNNCTLTGNSGRGASAWVEEGQVSPTTVNNCIVYSNTGGNYDSFTILNYSCTTPLPTNGVGNITNAPLFVDAASGNLRLQSNSPCIDAGLNAFAPPSPDLDGQPRISGGSVDMGAYEFQSPISLAPQLAITSAGASIIVTWPTNDVGFTYEGQTYTFASQSFTLQSSSSLGSPESWVTVSPGPAVVNGQNIVTNSVSAPQLFYRLRPPPCWPPPADCGYVCVNGVWAKNTQCRTEW